MNRSTEPPGRLAAIEDFRFRDVHPNVRFGTASDRYGGWVGQIYSRDRWAQEITDRKRRLDGDTYEEHVLPVASVEEYMEHFHTLEIDFTFYRPLLEEDGSRGSNWFVLAQYAEHAPSNARFILKAPQAYSARTFRRNARGGRPTYVENPTYLDAGSYVQRFLEPAAELLGSRLAGVLFQQEYVRVKEAPPEEAFIGELDGFFRSIPDILKEVQSHIEVRSGHLLTEPYFGWLESRGIGHCFSHWTWLPPIRKQWDMAGQRFTSANGDVLLRLLTPLNMRYADAYARAYPFDKPVRELAETPGARAMVDETVALAVKAIESGRVIDVLANNRAYGNAPALAQTVAKRLVEVVG